MKKIIFILSLLTLCQSCNKNEIKYNFNGVIKDYNNELINDCEVSVYVKELSNGTLNNNWIKKNTFISNNEGAWQGEIDRTNITELEIRANKTNYFEEILEANVENLMTESTNSYDHVLTKKGWVKFVVKNNAPSAPEDNFKIQINNSGYLNPNIIQAQTFVYNGANIDTELKIEYVGDEYIKFLKIDSNIGTTSDSLFVPHGDTVFYNINY